MKKLSLKKIVTLLLVCTLMVSVCLGLGIKQVKAEEENKLEALKL